MISMTGFGYSEGEGAGVAMSVEIKSLNTRYLDLIMSLPPSLSILEPRLRERLTDTFVRGRIEVTVRSRDIEDQLVVKLDPEAASAWKTALENLGAILGGDQRISLEMLTGLEGVFKTERIRDPEKHWSVLEPLFQRAADDVLDMKRREGEELRKDIESQLTSIEESMKFICERAPDVKKAVETSLRARFTEILGDEAGEQRILQETAAWVVRTDINEETVRLESHISAFRDEADAPGPKGKKLDFLAQEMGREVNTIGSKSPDAGVSREVVNMKDALEKVREQLRNVE
jgi:uncharacterized protein (TIGR00255 family)